MRRRTADAVLSTRPGDPAAPAGRKDRVGAVGRVGETVRRTRPEDRVRPRADGDSVAVALASMLCKYLREVCMVQFNAFWAKHVPGIQPTAGYPVDAKRFIDEIRPAMERLGIPEAAVWRVK